MATSPHRESVTSPTTPPHPANPKRAAADTPPPTRVWLKGAVIAFALLALAGFVAVVLVIRHFEADLPSILELKSYHPPQVTRVLARDGTVLGEVFVERRTLVSIDEIPSRMKLSVL